MEKKVAVVTGASRGIGAAIARELAAAGMYVMINYCGSEEKAQELKNALDMRIKSVGVFVNESPELICRLMFLTTWHVKNLLEM